MDKMTKNQFLVSVLVVVLAAMIAFPSVMAKGKPACNDRVDNDGDGYADLKDSGCSDTGDKSELNQYVECDDGLDNDGDGFADYRDAGCGDTADGDESNCGDLVCEGTETQANCPVDCGYPGFPDSCEDTDGGNNLKVAGTVSGYYGGNSYSDADSCIDNSALNEYYCNGNYAASQVQNCGTSEYGPTYCGANNSTYPVNSDEPPALPYDCAIGDCVNTSVYSDYTSNGCSGDICISSATPQFVQACPYGCKSGVCNPIPPI